MVDVAQWLEHRIVVPGVVGSTPIFHPHKKDLSKRGLFCFMPICVANTPPKIIHPALIWECKKVGLLVKTATILSAILTNKPNKPKKIHPTSIFGCKKGCKSRNYLIYTLCCGERGIRTPGGVTLNGFQDRRNRPLCHLSF